MNIDQFFSAYVTCALWSSTDDDGNPLDDIHDEDDISADTLASMREDCENFIASNAELLAEYDTRMSCEQWTGATRAGHDFWLTRNGHGAGFWDRGLGDLGCELSSTAEVYGSVDLYVGDDGVIYA